MLDLSAWFSHFTRFKICNWATGKIFFIIKQEFSNKILLFSTVIIFSTPVFVAILSRIFLGEKCGLFNIFTICLTLLGIVFIVKPPSLFEEKDDPTEEKKSDYLLGPLAALASAIFTSSAMILIRVLKGEFDFSKFTTKA